MSSGGLRTSVKADIIAQRVASLAVHDDNGEAMITHLAPPAETTMAAASSNSYGICDGNMPCLPILGCATKSCEVNRVPLSAQSISVNGEPLTPEELCMLQSCPNPPKKLKPGNYWYDKTCGLWGKEGQKPSDVISPRLCVGGHMKDSASNGNTQVFINGREITKVELRALQMIGVDFSGNPRFWVYEDGTYKEEGQCSLKESIWGLAVTKVVCAVFSLPVPSKSSIPVIPDIIEQKPIQKILLVGCNGSGASIIFKQAKILYEPNPFSVDVREFTKFTIQRNLFAYLGILLEVRGCLEDECLAEIRMQHSSCQSVTSGNTENTPYTIGHKLKAFADWLLKTVVSGYVGNVFPAAAREFAPFVEQLWNDSAIQATYKRSSELGMLTSVATYFINRAIEILKVNYEPTDQDILYAECDTSSNGLACVDFSLPQTQKVVRNNFRDSDTIYQRYSLLRYQLVEVKVGLGECCEWSSEVFGDVGIVMFCVSLTEYDQFFADSNGTSTNKMLQSRSVFERIVAHPTFEDMNFLLLLNDFDLFVRKIARAPLNRCEWFDDFNPVTNSDMGHRAYEYIAVKFKRLYASLRDKRLYVSLLADFEPDNVREALRYSTEILNWDEVRGSWCYFSESDTDIETDFS